MQEFSMTLLTNCCNGLKTADVFSPSFQNIYFDFIFFKSCCFPVEISVMQM